MNDIEIEIVEADLSRADHRRDVLAMIDAYARDPMGNDGPLSDDVYARLIDGLRDHPTTLVFLAYAGEEAVGVATCFVGFSTFYARPLVNVHDLSVVPAFRGRGVGRVLLAAVEAKARRLDCCKVTLEVLADNARARAIYERVGFAPAVYGGNTGGTLFYAKVL
ncbi:MAG: GNAT family N-acetyltransferase [Pirellulales bacterium]